MSNQVGTKRRSSLFILGDAPLFAAPPRTVHGVTFSASCSPPDSSSPVSEFKMAALCTSVICSASAPSRWGCFRRLSPGNSASRCSDGGGEMEPLFVDPPAAEQPS